MDNIIVGNRILGLLVIIISILANPSLQWSNTTLFLEGDGHFSEEGAKTMAAIVVDAIRKQSGN